MSSTPNIQLDYTVPVKFKRSADQKVLLIEGMAIDDTVNANMWQVPEDELPYFVLASQNAQIRVDHGDNVEDVKGSVNILKSPQVASDGRIFVSFEGEVSGDEEFLSKLEREYVNSVSPRVLGEAYCSACGSRSRDDKMNLVHICRGAWEIMRKPHMVELSIVSIGAYEHAKFKPVGFAAAMNQNQQSQISQALMAKKKPACEKCASLSFNCLNCSQERLTGLKAGEANQQIKEKNKMSASDKPLDADAVKALIDEHAKNLAEACKAEAIKGTAEAIKATAEACKSSIAEAVKEAMKLEKTALLAQMEDAVNKAITKQRSPGKGQIGKLNELNEPPQKLQPGMVAVPSYFKELAMAAEKKKAFDASVRPGGLS